MNHSTASRCAQQKICGYEYTVKRGDSFYLIAQRLGVPLRDLLEANSSINPARLMVGDVLCIPMEEDDAVILPAQEPETDAEEAPQIAPDVELAPMPRGAESTDSGDPDACCDDTQPADAGVADDADQTDAAGSAVDAVVVEGVSEAADAAPDAAPVDSRYTVAAGETVADIQQSADLSFRTLAAANPDVDLDALSGGETLILPSSNKPCAAARFYRMQDSDNLERLALQLDLSVGALLRANPCLAPSDFKGGTVISLP